MDKTTDYEQQILRSLKGLSPELLAEVADFIEFIRRRRVAISSPAIDTPVDETRKNWRDLAGTIPVDDLELMRQAIEEGCEKVDLDEW